jgi:hypothetical protein
MWFTLARMLHMTVAQCQQNMPSSEFAEWKFVLDSNPPSDVKRSKEAASICAAVLSSGGKRIRIDECELRYRPTRHPFIAKPVDEIRSKLQAFFSRGKDKQ